MFGLLGSLVATLLMPLQMALLLVLLGAWNAARALCRTGFVAMLMGFLLQAFRPRRHRGYPCENLARSIGLRRA